VQNATLGSGWILNGTWNVPGASGPTAISVAPSSGSGSSQAFAFNFLDPAGATDISSAQIVIDGSLSGTGSCYLYFYGNGANVIYLASDAGAFESGISLGTVGTLQNSQCTINVGASSAILSGTTLALNLAVGFQHAFAGAKIVYMFVQNASIGSGWTQQGIWTVP